MWRTLVFVVALIGLVASSSTADALTYSRKVCATSPSAGNARCHAIVDIPNGIEPQVSSQPKGYGPSDFRSAYGVTGSANPHVGIVVAYDAPDIASDVNTYSKTFGLASLPSCTSSKQTGCFEKFDEHGGTSYPARNSSWAVEASLDVESAHGMCPGCRISLVEASSASMNDLATAVDTAAAKGGKVISNSYGEPESAGETAYDSHYNKPGITTVVSSGDDGYGTEYPAASPAVVAVGGTSLTMNGSKVKSEVAWNGSGSGCSQFELKPSWQHDKKCTKRSIADIAADADPNTGAAIYDSYTNSGHTGWFTVGGTSLAAPLVAGILAVSGNAAAQPAALYSSHGSIRDITSGDNGSCSTYLCEAGVGYDGPTGLGVLAASRL